MIPINTQPTRSQLFWFGIGLVIFVPLLSLLVYWRHGSQAAAFGILVGGGLLTLVFGVIRAARRPIYVGWMILVFPIGWFVSHVVLAVCYFLVLTPIGLVLRLTGRHLIPKKPAKEAETYWSERPAPGDKSRYFRQF